MSASTPSPTRVARKSSQEPTPSSCAAIRSPIRSVAAAVRLPPERRQNSPSRSRSEEHTSELQSRLHLVCRLLLEKKKKTRHGQTQHDRSYATAATAACN